MQLKKKRAAVDGLELEYELRGSGEPVVLIHWGVSATWAEPLLEEPALADHFRLVSYHRAGFGGSSAIEGPVTIADHAKHCRLLMRKLGIERAHIVGHSSSVAVALQLALDAPDAVYTLVSMDAARPAPPTELQATFRREFVEPAVDRYAPGTRKLRSTRSSAASSGRTTATRSSTDSPAPSTTPSPTRTRSSPRSCPHSGSVGRSRKKTHGASRNPCSPSSASTALPPFPSGASSCSPGYRT